MKLTVLGRYGPYPAPGGATSGYLVESGGTRLLLECGSGVVSNLLRVCPATALAGVMLSHLHMDHAGDLGVLRYALEAAGAQLPAVAPDAPEDAAALLLRHAAYRLERAEEGREYRFGALAVDAQAAQVTVNGTPVALTAQEYRLLLLLVSHAGRVWERGQLLQALWDDGGAFVEDNTLTVTVKRLREKLGAEGARIATVRGIGYRWEDGL